MYSKHDSSESKRPPRPFAGPVPKLCGADVELGNLVRGFDVSTNTCRAASQLILRAIAGVPHSRWSNSGWTSQYNYSHSCTTADAAGGFGGNGNGKSGQSAQPRYYEYDSQDWGRKYLSSNGGCVYIDLNHLELCLPELRGAFEFVAAWHAMLLIAREAMDRVNATARDGLRVQVLVNNSDGCGNSYGGHLNFLLSRRAWNNIFHRKPHHMAYLASYQVSSLPVTGQGKVGAENDAPAVAYQLSQRADFFEKISGTQTTFERPIVNGRDEALCGPRVYRGSEWIEPDLARLHCIFFDSNLCHVACLLKVGMMQIVLAMLEANRVNPALILDDPLEAVEQFSHDPSLQARARMASGKKLTAVELQLLFLEEAESFLDRGGCEEVVPRAGEILALYADTLEKLHAGDLDAVAGRLDWVLKLRILQRAMHKRPGLGWDSPEIKLLDHLYSSLDPAEGFYWIYEKAGVTEQVASPAEIERFVHEPPEDTRAYARAILLRLADPSEVSRIDWDSICFKLPGRSGWPIYRTLDMPDPLGFTKARTAAWLESGQPLDVILDRLMTIDSAGSVSHDTLGLSDAGPQPAPLLLPAPKKVSGTFFAAKPRHVEDPSREKGS